MTALDAGPHLNRATAALPEPRSWALEERARATEEVRLRPALDLEVEAP
jgi:hypothetical protein